MQHRFYHPSTIWSFLFGFHSEPIFRRLWPIVLLMLIYAGIVSTCEYLLHDYYKIFDNFTYLNQFHLLFNFVLSILIAFRLNTAYSGWWEGRGLWGALTNHSRNLAMRFDTYLGLARYPQFSRYLATFPTVLKFHLRRDGQAAQKVMLELGFTPSAGTHLPNLLIQTMNQVLNQARQANELSLEQFLLLNENLAALTDVLGGCEKILNTPVPSPINTLIKQALLFYMLIFPFGWAGTFGFFVLPMIIVMIYVLWGLEALADELEDPFGLADVDLPLDTMARNIAANIEQIAENLESSEI